MSGTTWSKFFWADWQSDPALRLCSFAAKGLWMDLLCIAAAHDPIGYVAVAGRGLNETSIARMTGGLESEVRVLLGELEQNGVFSRDRKGVIFSRRLLSDARRAAIARKNGKSGGNPSLLNGGEKSGLDNQPDKPPLKPHEPLATSHDVSSLRSDTGGGEAPILGASKLPDFVPKIAWAGYVEMRRRIRAPLTPRAVDLTITKLEKLHAAGEDIGTVLDLSTQNSWRGVFPVKQSGDHHGKRSTPHENFAIGAYLAADDAA